MSAVAPEKMPPLTVAVAVPPVDSSASAKPIAAFAVALPVPSDLAKHSFPVALLSTLGFRVAAVTGRRAESDFLKQLGASEILDQAQFATAGKPLAKERWAAAIDVVGSGRNLAP